MTSFKLDCRESLSSCIFHIDILLFRVSPDCDPQRVSNVNIDLVNLWYDES